MEKPSGKKKTLPGKTASLVTRGKQNKLSATQLLTLFTGRRWGKVCMGTGGRSNRQQCSCILAVTDHLYISLNEQITSIQFYSPHNVRCGLMNKLLWRKWNRATGRLQKPNLVRGHSSTAAFSCSSLNSWEEVFTLHCLSTAAWDENETIRIHFGSKQVTVPGDLSTPVMEWNCRLSQTQHI